jgi:hypothetical protein
VSGFKRALVCAVCVTATFSGVIAAPAFAAQPPAISATVNAEEPSDLWLWVRYLAGAHPYGTVRTAAWSALVSSDPDAALVEFDQTGYDYAVSRAQERRSRNLDFIRRVYETTTFEYSPEVNSETRRLLGSGATDSQRELFVRSGYEAAKSRDRSYRDEIGEQKRALVQRDRDFVRLLSTNDPGEQVRLSASHAVRDGATDDHLVEFFAYGWATGSRLDLEVFRMRQANDNMKWRATVTRLIADAQAAEKAAREASEETKAQAKATAVRAWQQVGTETAPARSSWTDAQEFAQRQADNWRAVLEAATAAQGPNWTAMVEPARSAEATWLTEQGAAQQQAAYWNALLQQALAAEQRVRDTP